VWSQNWGSVRGLLEGVKYHCLQCKRQRKKRPIFKISYLRPSKCRPLQSADGAHAPFAPLPAATAKHQNTKIAFYLRNRSCQNIRNELELYTSLHLVVGGLSLRTQSKSNMADGCHLENRYDVNNCAKNSPNFDKIW